MLIRGETTEDRIAKIAQGFGQGAQNFIQGQERQRAQDLQKEALKRQEALKALEASNSLTEKTGKLVTPEMISPMLANGDFSGLGEILKSAPMTQKSQMALDDKKLARELTQSQIDKNNRVTTKAPKENLTYAEKLQMKAEFDAANAAKPDSKLKSLGAEGRSKVGSIASGFQALDQMVKSSDDGFKPSYLDANTPIVGAAVSDTPYTEGERMLSEVIGRLQSGGAINDQEIKTFRALGPRPGDDAQSRTRKLAQQKDFLKNKLTSFGLSLDDISSLGFETSSKYVPKKSQDTDAKYQRLLELRAKAGL